MRVGGITDGGLDITSEERGGVRRRGKKEREEGRGGRRG